METEKEPAAIVATEEGVLPRLGTQLSQVLQQFVAAVAAGDEETMHDLLAEAHFIRGFVEAERASVHRWSTKQKIRNATQEQQ